MDIDKLLRDLKTSRFNDVQTKCVMAAAPVCHAAQIHEFRSGMLKTAVSDGGSPAGIVDVLIYRLALRRMEDEGRIRRSTEAEVNEDLARLSAVVDDCERLGVSAEEQQSRILAEFPRLHRLSDDEIAQVLDYVEVNGAEVAKFILRSGVVQEFSRRGAANIRESVPLRADRPHSFKEHYGGCHRQVVGIYDFLAKNDHERFIWIKPKATRRHARRRQGGANHQYARTTLFDTEQSLSFRGVIRRATRWRGGVYRQGWLVADHEELAHREGDYCVIDANPILTELCRRAGIAAPDRTPSERRPKADRTSTEHPPNGDRTPTEQERGSERMLNRTPERTDDTAEKSTKVSENGGVSEDNGLQRDAISTAASETVSRVLTLGTSEPCKPVEPIETREREEPAGAAPAARAPHSLSQGIAATAAPAQRPDSGQRTVTVADVIRIAKRTEENARFTRRDKAEITGELNNARPSLTELEHAVGNIVVALDAFELRRAGEYIANELAAQVEKRRRDVTEYEAQQRMIEGLRAEGRRQADEELKAIEAAEAEEGALIEQELGG